MTTPANISEVANKIAEKLHRFDTTIHSDPSGLWVGQEFRPDGDWVSFIDAKHAITIALAATLGMKEGQG